MSRKRLFLIVLLTVFALRVLGLYFGVTDNDETDFITIGRVMRQGGLPYLDVFDHKPPLLYLLYFPSAFFTWLVGS
jgi:hypothetical protein